MFPTPRRRASLLSLCLLCSAGCAETTKEPPARIVVAHPVTPSTHCARQPQIPEASVRSPEAFAAWLSGPEGLRWIADSRANGADCHTKLGAIGAANTEGATP